MTYVSLNGKHFTSNEPLIFANNRGFKYGDGFFETIRVRDGLIQLMKYHFERITSSAAILEMNVDDLDKNLLTNEILNLCSKNGCAQSSRVRIAFYRSEENRVEYLMEAVPLENKDIHTHFTIDLYKETRKQIDILSNLKTANYLPYVMAAMDAQRKSVDDCLIMNSKGTISDSSKANIFIIKNGIIRTPALSEGCVSGTMRKYLLEKCRLNNIEIIEDQITFEDVLEADEVFLTNAIIGIQPVGKCLDRVYPDDKIQDLLSKVTQPFSELIVD